MSETKAPPSVDEKARPASRTKWRRYKNGWSTHDDRARVWPYERGGWIPWSVTASGGVYPSLREAQRVAERWVRIADGVSPLPYVIAADEWPAAWWDQFGADDTQVDGYLYTDNARYGAHRVRLWLARSDYGEWQASILVVRRGAWLQYGEKRSQSPRAALRALRYGLGSAIAAATRDLLRGPTINWREVRALSAVAMEWAPDNDR